MVKLSVCDVCLSVLLASLCSLSLLDFFSLSTYLPDQLSVCGVCVSVLLARLRSLSLTDFFSLSTCLPDQPVSFSSCLPDQCLPLSTCLPLLLAHSLIASCLPFWPFPPRCGLPFTSLSSYLLCKDLYIPSSVAKPDCT